MGVKGLAVFEMKEHPSIDLVAKYDPGRFSDSEPNLYSIRYDTVLFDFDGPLVDHALWDAALDELAMHGFPWSEVRKRIIAIKNESGWLNSRTLFERCNEEAVNHDVYIDYDLFLRKALKKSREPGNPLGSIAHHDAAQTLEALILSGVQVAIVTNEDLAATRVKLEMSGLGVLFDRYAIPIFAPLPGGPTPIRGKPHPDLILQAIEELGADPALTLFVGDRDTDSQAVRNTGLPMDIALIERTHWPGEHDYTFFLKGHLQAVYTLASPSIIVPGYLDSPDYREDLDFLEQGIADILLEFVEGPDFFTQMDHYIKNHYRVTRLVLNEIDRTYPDYDTIIFSGDIGHIWGYAPLPPDKQMVKVVGSLRPKGVGVHSITDIRGRRCVFADDSLYGGRTLVKVVDFIRNKGGIYLGAVTAYDGSSEEKKMDLTVRLFEQLSPPPGTDPTLHGPRIRGIWSYFDHFDSRGKPLENSTFLEDHRRKGS
jgi:phosphoglycolate phosphatase-like HAD superfamily hydrolase